MHECNPTENYEWLLMNPQAFALCSYILMFVALEHGAGIAPDHLSVHEYHTAASVSLRDRATLKLSTNYHSTSSLASSFSS